MDEGKSPHSMRMKLMKRRRTSWLGSESRSTRVFWAVVTAFSSGEVVWAHENAPVGNDWGVEGQLSEGISL